MDRVAIHTNALVEKKSYLLLRAHKTSNLNTPQCKNFNFVSSKHSFKPFLRAREIYAKPNVSIPTSMRLNHPMDGLYITYCVPTNS